MFFRKKKIAVESPPAADPLGLEGRDPVLEAAVKRILGMEGEDEQGEQTPAPIQAEIGMAYTTVTVTEPFVTEPTMETPVMTDTEPPAIQPPRLKPTTTEKQKAVKWEPGMPPVMIPDRDFLDEYGFEYVGFRKPESGDYFITMQLQFSNNHTSVTEKIFGGKRWIVKIKDPQETKSP